MSIDPSDRLLHILKEVEYLSKTYKQLRDINHLETDEHLSRSVIRSLEIIGEATKALPESLRLEYQDIPWRDIARMRDNLIHRYFGVRYNIVWQVLEEDIIVLKQQIPGILKNVYRYQYLEYKNQIISQKQSSSFSKYLNSEIDKAIAKIVLQEYDLKYRKTAIVRAKDILSQSEVVSEYGQDAEQIELYLDRTIKSAANDLNSGDRNIER